MGSLNITQNIGKIMPHGQAGSYARQPDMIVNTFPAGGSANIPFGTPLKLSSGAVVAMGAGDSSANFIGFASREVKSALDYTSQGTGVYAPNDPVAVFQRGSINVICQRGTPAYGTAVYLRTVANASYPTAVVGGLEAAADAGKTIQLTNCAWQGPADANNVAELRILSLMEIPAQGAAVADAAGAAPTAAEFKALLDSLRDAGIIATA